MTVYCRVTSDGYLLYAATGDDYTGSDRYWPDYYGDDFGGDGLEIETIAVEDVPPALADKLCEQGGSGQVYSDGYEAWQAVLVHVHAGKEV
jgi:hypothetical protein